jgi:RloB-like protein
MGKENRPWKKKNRSIERRSNGRGELPKTFLIICEGEKTEPNYFESFKLPSASVKVVGCGQNTNSLVKKALELLEKFSINNKTFDQVWCVFDRDSFPLRNFNAAFELAKGNNIKIAYSNEAFELWYLLHFNYYDSAISRGKYKKMLTKLMGQSYKKNSVTIYEEIRSKQKDAIRNAKRLLKSYGTFDPGKNKPSTTVHELVIELNKFLP